jgi:hypothetical protein
MVILQRIYIHESCIFFEDSFWQAMDDLVLGGAFSPSRRISLASIIILDK